MKGTCLQTRAALAFAALVGLTSEAGAVSPFGDLVPNGRVLDGDGCVTCHADPSGTTGLNAFGDDFQSQGLTWAPILAAMDSDFDGHTNGEELLDPSGTWTPEDPQPGSPAQVSNPGDSASVPPAPAPLLSGRGIALLIGLLASSAGWVLRTRPLAARAGRMARTDADTRASIG